MRRILFFTARELAFIVAVGVATGLVDGRIETVVFTLVRRSHELVLLNDYLQYVTGGYVFGDLVEAWLEFGGVFAACLVRKPGAATVALTINGACQVFLAGTHDPHLFYGVPGLGADLVFAYFRFRRYDVISVALAGAACAMFWYPIVWFTHGIFLYPISFVAVDLGFRALGGAVGDGLVGGALAVEAASLVGRRWDSFTPMPLEAGMLPHRLKGLAALVASAGSVLVVTTYAVPEVARFFVEIGPGIPAGLPFEEEFNPGYVIGLLMVFLVVVMLAFWRFRSSYLGD